MYWYRVFSDVYKLIEQFEISNPELFEKLKSKCHEEYKLKKDELNAEYLPNINKLKKYDSYSTEYCAKIKKTLKIVPHYYFNEKAIRGILFLYITKRGNTISELVNLYEDEKFREKLLNAINKNTEVIQNFTSSVNDLTKVVNDRLENINNTLKKRFIF